MTSVVQAAARALDQVFESAGTKIEQAAAVASHASQEGINKLKAAFSNETTAENATAKASDVASSSKQSRGKNTRRSFQNLKHDPNRRQSRPPLLDQPPEVQEVLETLPFDVPVEQEAAVDQAENAVILGATLSDWFQSRFSDKDHYKARYVEVEDTTLRVRDLPGNEPLLELSLEKVDVTPQRLRVSGGNKFVELKPCRVTHSMSDAADLLSMKAEIVAKKA